MRRCALLIVGLCTGFCIFWMFLSRITTYYRDDVFTNISIPAESQQGNTLQFPFTIPGTTLIAEQIVSYDGRIYDENTACDVMNVAALLVYNYGSCGITDVEVKLTADGVTFSFSADTIPSGARILVPEQACMGYGPRNFSSCSGKQKSDTSDWINEDVIDLQYRGMGEVVVRNLTDHRIYGIYLFYKSCVPEFYVGGNTWIYYVEMLDAGQNIHIYPYNYAYGYSKFLRVMITEP